MAISWDNTAGTLTIGGGVDISDSGYIWEISGKPERESERMESFLTDLAVNLNLTKEQVDEIRRVMGHGNWLDRLLLYILAGMVKEDGDFGEKLGYVKEK